MTKQAEHAQLEGEYRDLSEKRFTPTPSPVPSPAQSDDGGEKGEANDDEEVASDVPMEHTSNDVGVAGDAARPVAGIAKKRRCLGSVEMFSKRLWRERLNQSLWRMRCASKLGLHDVLNRQKIQMKEPLKFFGCKKKRRLMKGTLCFCHRKGNSSESGWVLVTKKKKERKGNFLKKDFSIFKPFSSRAAASF